MTPPRRGGDTPIDWQINRDWDQLANFLSVVRCRHVRARSDIVQRVLDTRGKGEAMKAINDDRLDTTPASPSGRRHDARGHRDLRRAEPRGSPSSVPDFTLAATRGLDAA